MKKSTPVIVAIIVALILLVEPKMQIGAIIPIAFLVYAIVGVVGTLISDPKNSVSEETDITTSAATESYKSEGVSSFDYYYDDEEDEDYEDREQNDIDSAIGYYSENPFGGPITYEVLDPTGKRKDYTTSNGDRIHFV